MNDGPIVTSPRATKPQVAPGETAPAEQAAVQAAGWLRRLRMLAAKHAEPAHDEDQYYNPRPRPDPWEGSGYLLMAVSAGVAGWLLWIWWSA